MDRRYAIKQILVASAGMILVPSCMGDRTKASFLLKNYAVTGEQEKMLAELAETIIPRTATPGAKDVYAHQFAMKMMDDCASKEDQEKFVKGIEAFSAFSKKNSGKDFLEASAAQRATILQELEKRKEDGSDEGKFYRRMKSLTIRGYTNSQYFLTEVQVYNMIPGKFKGCVPVKQSA
jgi:hypothetical protein